MQVKLSSMGSGVIARSDVGEVDAMSHYRLLLTDARRKSQRLSKVAVFVRQRSKLALKVPFDARLLPFLMPKVPFYARIFVLLMSKVPLDAKI